MPDEVTEGKRGVTYQIMKNKGLMPHRKKEDRNPRKRMRNKFDKALTKRKSMVQEIRQENAPFSGEKSGIRANVVRSTKL